jgi:hypothetical protein
MSEIVLSDEEAKRIVREAMENFPEASSPSLPCVHWKYEEMQFVFIEDNDENQVKHTVNEEMLVKGLRTLLKLSVQGKYHNNDFPNGFEDTSNWDATDFDALVQCAIFGEIIYG